MSQTGAPICATVPKRAGSAEGEAVAEANEARLRTGRLLGTDAWIAALEAQLGRPLQPQRRGPKAKRKGGDGGAN